MDPLENTMESSCTAPPGGYIVLAAFMPSGPRKGGRAVSTRTGQGKHTHPLSPPTRVHESADRLTIAVRLNLSCFVRATPDGSYVRKSFCLASL